MNEAPPAGGAGRHRLLDLEIDPATRSVKRAGGEVDVGGLSFDLLAFLLGCGTRVVTFDELIAAVWAPAVVNEETVTQRVKLLRQALGDDGRHPRYVRSVRGRGYQLCAPPQALADEAPPRRWRPLIAGALAALTAGALVAAHAWRSASSPAAPAHVQDERLQRARYYAGIGQDDNNERAIALYEEMLRDTPADVDARLGLAFAYGARVCLYNREPDWSERALALAQGVSAAQPGNSLAHAAAGYAHDCRGEIDAAIGEYERAVALDPQARVDSLASAANLYAAKGRLADALRADLQARGGATQPRFLDLQIARVLELLGFTAAAERRYERVFRLYPDNVFGNVDYPRCLFLQGRLAEAAAALEQAQQRPRHPDLALLEGELALLRGERAAAGEAFARAAALRPHAGRAALLAGLHSPTPADAAWIAVRADELRASLEGGGDWPDGWLDLAVLELARGAREQAFDALQRAADAGYRDRAYLQTSALFRPLAADPRFAATLDAIGRAVARERDAVLADGLPTEADAGTR
ncbi:MAG: winged helix-turn-helix domain-containing protein [Dokdonella sp.]|uniref:winged helix-turn-helix domain-containing protein n=1 Tax=Dokdonella sp. TaxID=2291710 RepID=UPI003F8199D6